MIYPMTINKTNATPKINREACNKDKVTLDDLKKRVKFFSKHILGLEYFGRVEIVSNTVIDESSGDRKRRTYRGCFASDEESYKSDLDAYYNEYKSLGKEDSIRDSYIEIRRDILKDVVLLNDVLLHELIHYKNWYTGLDCEDGQAQFEDELKKYKVSSNYIASYDNKHKKWIREINREAMIEYENLYQEWQSKN